jgi:ribose transport system substrate-binding protein
MGKMKKFIVLLLALCCLFSLAACRKKTVETNSIRGKTVGINTLVVGAYALDILTTGGTLVLKANGNAVVNYNDEGSVEKVITNLENMISAGSDGIMWFGLIEPNFAVGPRRCENAGIPFALFDKVPLDETNIANMRNLKMFAGAVTNDDYQGGINMGNQALKDDRRIAVILGAEIGDPTHDMRIKGFTDAFEAGGGKVVEVSHVSANAGQHQNMADNMLGAHPDADCFFGSGGDHALGGVNAVVALGKTDEINVYGVDISPDLLPYLKDGRLDAASGAHWVSSAFAACLLQNALDGHPTLDTDGKGAIIRTIPLIVIPKEYADLYQKFFIDEYPYELSEFDHLLWRNNPNVTVQDFKDMIAEYNVENRFIAKYKASKVTANELAAVGIKVN